MYLQSKWTDTENQFFKEVYNEVAHQTSKWESIAINLDIDSANVDQISRSKNSIPDCFREVFTKWRDQMKHPFNWNTMVDILDCEHYLAKTLHEKYLA